MKKMRKITAAILLQVFVLSLSVFPNENNNSTDSNIVKVSDLTNGYRLFGGYNFGDRSSKLHEQSMETRVNAEINYVLNEDKDEIGKYAIVGHSQGGLRVLAYATMLERRANDMNLPEEERALAKANFERLGAVITMSGIDKGLKAIENDFSTLKSKLYEDVDILSNGFLGIASAIPLIGLIPSTLRFFNISLTDLIENPGKDFYNMIIKMNPAIEHYAVSGLFGAKYDQIAEIYDMIPGSEFIKKNVSETTTVTYKRQTGTRKYTTWEKVGWLWWWWVDHEEPVYTTYTAYKDNPKFSQDIPIGYIVGIESNTLSLLSEDEEKEARELIKSFRKNFEEAQIANHVECYATLCLGFLTGHYTAYRDCCKARDWCDNFDNEMNELKGSSENDGLVAKECQFYPRQFYNPVTGKYEEVHSNVLGKDPRGYTEVKKNHADINCAEVKETIVMDMIKEAFDIQKDD